MFSKIMVPVDLAHADKIERALDVAAKLARSYGSEVVYVGVTNETPSEVAHSSAEYREKLAAFAKERTDKEGHAATAHVVTSHDVAVDLDRKLQDAAHETGADLVVMATHVPGFGDRFAPNHGGALARHADISVFLVRG